MRKLATLLEKSSKNTVKFSYRKKNGKKADMTFAFISFDCIFTTHPAEGELNGPA